MAKRKYGSHSVAANRESAWRGRSHDDSRRTSNSDVRSAHLANDPITERNGRGNGPLNMMKPLRHTASAAARNAYGEYGDRMYESNVEYNNDRGGNMEYNRRSRGSRMIDGNGQFPSARDSAYGDRMADRSGEKWAMQTNNRGGSFMKEDWNAPALTPRGVHEFRVDGTTRNHRSGRLGDLFEQVEWTMREDQAAFDSITDPTNW